MRRLLSAGWLACHLLAVVLVVGMLGLAGWQFARAAGGNALSWGYTLQWPVFAGFVVFIWVREVRRVLREQVPAASSAAASGSAGGPASATGPAAVVPPAAVAPAGAGRRSPVVTRRPAAPPDDSGDPELAAYNRYLAWLRANPGARPVDYPG